MCLQGAVVVQQGCGIEWVGWTMRAGTAMPLVVTLHLLFTLNPKPWCLRLQERDALAACHEALSTAVPSAALMDDVDAKAKRVTEIMVRGHA